MVDYNKEICNWNIKFLIKGKFLLFNYNDSSSNIILHRFHIKITDF